MHTDGAGTTERQLLSTIMGKPAGTVLYYFYHVRPIALNRDIEYNKNRNGIHNIISTTAMFYRNGEDIDTMG